MSNAPSPSKEGNMGQRPFRILALDGGGAKGFYTIGVLSEIEAMTGQPIYQSFDLIFGTSTGAIIAALLARGESVATVRALYEQHVPTIMKSSDTTGRTGALHQLAHDVFKDERYDVFINVSVPAFCTLIGLNHRLARRREAERFASLPPRRGVDLRLAVICVHLWFNSLPASASLGHWAAVGRASSFKFSVSRAG